MKLLPTATKREGIFAKKTSLAILRDILQLFNLIYLHHYSYFITSFYITAFVLFIGQLETKKMKKLV